MAIFRGTYQGVAVRHAVVALIGPSYRVAVGVPGAYPARQDRSDDHVC